MGEEAAQTYSASDTLQDEHISQAITVVHDPRSDNEVRRQASQFLERLREEENAPEQGFYLASAQAHPPILRHYGLSLLDHAIRYKWAEYNLEQSNAVREWVLKLAHGSSDKDPTYMTNKVAELWVEIAKRSWAVDWMDMDEQLVGLWDGSTAQKLLVLNILETLSDEIFSTEDSVAALRGTELNRACVEIFVPAQVLMQLFPQRETPIKVRHGSEGWVSRLADTLDTYVTPKSADGCSENLVLRVMAAFRSCIGWVVPRALIETQSIERMCACLAVSDMGVQLAALDTLFALYNRAKISDEDFKDVVGPMFRTGTIDLLKQLYHWLSVDPSDIDDRRYLLLKRLSETVFNLGRLLVDRHSHLPEGSDLAGFVGLLMDVMKHDSLQVSIPALHVWVKFLNSDAIATASAIQNMFPLLLETCSQRLIRYEFLPHDSQHPSILFLNEDIETMPERHAFLGNYARFCNQVVERVVQQQPIDALYHILGQADQILAHLYDSEPPFNPSKYTKYSVPWLRLDAQFTVIEAALRGCLRWLTGSSDDSVKHQHDVMTSNLQVWCDRLLGLIFEDPRIKERVIQLVVGFACGPLRHDAQFGVRVFDHVLETNSPGFPDCTAYNDAVRELQVFRTHQLQRLGIRFADHLATIFDMVERKILAISQNGALDEEVRARYTSVLFVIVQRATNIETTVQEARLDQYSGPLIEKWQDEHLQQSLVSFNAFSQLLGLNLVQSYLSSHQALQIDDWSAQPLDGEGEKIQKMLQNALESLPLRSTKHMFAASVDKVESSPHALDVARRLWQKHLAAMLPPLLRLISYSHTCYDPKNWPAMTVEETPIIPRIFKDRFWQHGISQGTRDDFYANIGGTKATLEGFASSVRAAMRLIRETGYRLLYYMSLLGDDFYGLRDLPEPLAQTLFKDAGALSPHQMTVLIDTTRPILENCPANQREHFLPPLISALFDQVDQKTSAEWSRIKQRKSASSHNEDLAEEMKDESVLRQLTLAAVMLVATLLEPTKVHVPSTSKSKPNGIIKAQQPEPTRTFVLQTPRILKPLILFCTHALSMHDTRSCSLITKVLRTIINDFSGEGDLESDVREFISTDVLKACITSLNDAYFVDMQRDLAQLIASILTLYSPRTDTPNQVIMSLPGIRREKLEHTVRFLGKSHTNTKQQRALVLDLLKGFRSVPIQDQGKIPKPDPNKLRSTMQQRYMTADMEGMELRDKDEEQDLGGVAEMFK